MKAPVKIEGYNRLLESVQKEIDAGRVHVQHETALMYWRIGEKISKHMLDNEHRAGYGRAVLKKLSGDIQVNVKTLEKTIRFYREFPKGNKSSILSWTHYRALMAVKDKAKRRSLIVKALNKNLSTRQLQSEIKNSSFKFPKMEMMDGSLIAIRGPLYTYRVVNADLTTMDLDLGFNVKRRILASGVGYSAEGRIVKSVEEDSNYVLRSTQSRKEDLYNYKAKLLRVVDGDTLLVSINLGYDTWIKQKLRLRGIDCSEVGTGPGEKAKSFVEQVLDSLEYILIKTHSPDKYDRYLTDVWFSERNLYLNQLLVDKGLATKV